MTAVHESPPTSDKKVTRIPTQTSHEKAPDASLYTTRLDAEQSAKRLDAEALKTRLDIEKGVYPNSIIFLRGVFKQFGLTYPCSATEAQDKFEAFTNRALLTRTLYKEELLDPSNPTGKDREKYGEVLELIEKYADTPIMTGLDAIIKAPWVKDNPSIRGSAIEAFAIGSLMTLDANHDTPSFMLIDENPSANKTTE